MDACGYAGGCVPIETRTLSSRYSALSLARHALSDAPWPRAWGSPEPKSNYDVLIIGGGGHGLATAYYLAANHGIKNIAVLERAYIGSGNVGRNTTLVRSNYVIDGNTQFFEFSMKLWEGLSHALNFNVMLSQRGQIVLAHGPAQLDVLARKGNIMRLNGIDAELLDRIEELHAATLQHSPCQPLTSRRRATVARRLLIASHRRYVCSSSLDSIVTSSLSIRIT